MFGRLAISALEGDFFLTVAIYFHLLSKFIAIQKLDFGFRGVNFAMFCCFHFLHQEYTTVVLSLMN